MPIEAPEEVLLDEVPVEEAPMTPPQAAPSAAPSPVMGTLGGQRLIGYPGIDAATIAQYQARGNEADRDFVEALLSNSRIQDSQKAIDAAIRFQAMRQFERDLEAGKASGMSPEQSTIQALVRNSGRMFFNSPAAAERGMRAGTGPRVFQAPGVQPFAVGSSGTPFRLAVPPAGVRAYRTPGGREFATYGGQMRVLSAPAGSEGLTKNQQLAYLRRMERQESLKAQDLMLSPESLADAQARADQYRTQADALEQQLFGASGAGTAPPERGTIAPPSTVTESAASVPQGTRKPTELRVGQIYKGYRYNGKYPPSDRRSWDKVQ